MDKTENSHEIRHGQTKYKSLSLNKLKFQKLKKLLPTYI